MTDADYEWQVARRIRAEAERDRLREHANRMMAQVDELSEQRVERNAEIKRLREERDEARECYIVLFGKVSDAERFDTNAGDSAVSCVLAGAHQTFTDYANARVVPGSGV